MNDSSKRSSICLSIEDDAAADVDEEVDVNGKNLTSNACLIIDHSSRNFQVINAYVTCR
jgi:hypothetical protein